MLARCLWLGFAVLAVPSFAVLGANSASVVAGRTEGASGPARVGGQSQAAGLSFVVNASSAVAKAGSRVHFAAPSAGRISELAPAIFGRVRDLPVYRVEAQTWQGEHATVWRGVGSARSLAFRAPIGPPLRAGADQASVNFTKLSAKLALGRPT